MPEQTVNKIEVRSVCPGAVLQRCKCLMLFLWRSWQLHEAWFIQPFMEVRRRGSYRLNFNFCLSLTRTHKQTHTHKSTQSASLTHSLRIPLSHRLSPSHSLYCTPTPASLLSVSFRSSYCLIHNLLIYSPIHPSPSSPICLLPALTNFCCGKKK